MEIGSYHSSCTCPSKVDNVKRPNYFPWIRRLVEQPSNHVLLSRNITGKPFGYEEG